MIVLKVTYRTHTNQTYPATVDNLKGS